MLVTSAFTPWNLWLLSVSYLNPDHTYDVINLGATAPDGQGPPAYIVIVFSALGSKCLVNAKRGPLKLDDACPFKLKQSRVSMSLHTRVHVHVHLVLVLISNSDNDGPATRLTTRGVGNRSGFGQKTRIRSGLL